MRVCVCASERESVPVRKETEKKREIRAETKMDIVVRQRQGRQEYQRNKTNLT